MLVLVIAGLIFLMVFIALPALQRSQRDTQRRDDLARLSTGINQYQSNNRGKVPSTQDEWNAFLNTYMKQDDGEFQDPDGELYKIKLISASEVPTKGAEALTFIEDTTDPDNHTIYMYQSAKCDGENAVKANSGQRKLAFRYALEGSGTYCGNN